ncbi:hypothetical protein [Flavobacterium sp.]|uniref:hypothetical protein n=1 Tax=Flavobacterium sp. TaxID=239 RepID=UPI00248753E8|nr:hypothetical protein [Flavobacterium sp.]MDI1316911.1 hypothetical protein [Flavobacterium sp.]
MRFIIIILLLAFVSCNKKDIPKNGRLKIIPKYCKYDNIISIPAPKFKLFKKEENNSKNKLITESEIRNDNFTISNLEYGKYYVEYITIYNQKNFIDFEINKSTLKEVKICIDDLDYNENKNVLMVDELKNGETLIVEFFHQGCFDTYDKPVQLYITKKNGKFTAKYYNRKYNLSNPQIKILREFEIELRSNHSAGCSSIDTYRLFNKESRRAYEVSDGSCHEWNGFENLIKMIISKK